MKIGTAKMRLVEKNDSQNEPLLRQKPYIVYATKYYRVIENCSIPT